MSKQLRFHITAITAICVVVYAVFILMNPAPPPPTPEQLNHGRSLTIATATWGANCNDAIRAALLEREQSGNTEGSKPPAKKPDPNAPIPVDAPKVAQAPLALVTPNNVLPLVSTLCNGKLKCEFKTVSEVLKYEPFTVCAKSLELGYRCFAFDKLNTIKFGQGETTRLDCTEKKPEAEKPAAPATPGQ